MSIDPVDKPFSSKLTNSFDYTYTRWNELAENEVERKEGKGKGKERTSIKREWERMSGSEQSSNRKPL